MTNGLILLGFLAVIFALLAARARRRMGFGMTGRFFALSVSGFAIIVLILWATSRR
ncbi:MAG TPA: hypothetical protein VNF47_04750 [Streptosporangiaceae bacterium]|nr:hypothetical protein [Streptosporangiaceae bacterium]